MTAHVKVSGTWKAVQSAHVKVSGTWKEVTKGFVNVGGTWKEFYTNGPPTSFSADLTSPSYVSAGSELSGYWAAQACDNNAGTNWATSSDSPMSSHWWRQDFGAGNNKAIRKLTVRNSTHGGLGADQWYNTIKLQYSDDGSSWSDALEWYSASPTLTKTQDSTTVDSWIFQDHGAHRYWRVVGLSGIVLTMDGGYLGAIGEIEMMEAA